MTAVPQTTSDWKFDLDAGRLCLDFVNTVSDDRPVSPKEHLHRYADLVAFALQSGIVDRERARRLLAESERHPKLAASVFERSKEFREAIYRVFLAIAQGERPPAEDVELLNRELAHALCHQQLAKHGDGWLLDWRDGDAMDSILWTLSKSAAEVLTSEADRVRVCEAIQSGECYWLFIDETRNSSRRWCSMKSCGNRAKARRHYHRQKKRRCDHTPRV